MPVRGAAPRAWPQWRAAERHLGVEPVWGWGRAPTGTSGVPALRPDPPGQLSDAGPTSTSSAPGSRWPPTERPSLPGEKPLGAGTLPSEIKLASPRLRTGARRGCTRSAGRKLANATANTRMAVSPAGCRLPHWVQSSPRGTLSHRGGAACLAPRLRAKALMRQGWSWLERPHSRLH